MVKVVFLGRPGDVRISDLLTAALRQGGKRVEYLSPGGVQLCEDADFLVMDCGRSAQLELGDAFLVFKEGFEEMEGLRIRCSGTAVVFSQNAQAVQTVCENGLRTVTCGMLSKDTITLASHTGDSAMVALQRSILLPDQTVLEPMEIPLTLSRDWDVYSIMAVAAVLLLAGQLPLLEKLNL